MGHAGGRAGEAPIFLVNETGRALPLRHLPVHELQLPAPSAITSVEELAAGYVVDIRAIQPSGPYRLLGNALGGLVAYELASQLLGHDERVEFLGMIDCPRPRNAPARPSHAHRTVAVAERYCPQPLPIPVCYFATDTRPDLDGARSWRALAEDSLQVVTFTNAPIDDTLAAAIAEAPKQQLRKSVARQEEHNPLVTIHFGPADSVPLIFVPGAGSGVTSGMGLVESLNEQITIHGLQPRGFNRKEAPHRTVQAAAAAYLSALRQVQPRGPYRLAGHSFGGWVAFELACRLAAAGEAVDPIVLLDTEAPTPASIKPALRGRVDVLMKLIRSLEELSGRSLNLTQDELLALDYESQLARLTRGMKEIGVLPRSSDVGHIRGLVRVFEANLNTRYVPAQRFAGRAVLFQPTERSRPVDGEEECDPAAMCDAWQGHAGHLECIQVPGKHMTMLKPPYVDVIAGHLSRLWGGRS